MKTYFLHNGSSQEGPFTIDQLKSKNLQKDSPIWREGIEGWTTVENLPEFNSLFATPPPFSALPFSNSSQPQALFSEKKEVRHNLLIPATVIGVVICLAIVGVFLTQNANQNEALTEVKAMQVEMQGQQLQEQAEKAAKEEERRRANEELTRKNMEYRNNWQNYISLGDTYANIDDTWGGVDAFELPIVNNTDYLLDEVQVSVNYIKANGGIYKTEIVTVTNIPPHSSKTGIAPSSPRGTSVTNDILSVVSKKMHFCYPINNGNSQDPYFCK